MLITLALHALMQAGAAPPPRQSLVRDSVSRDSLGRYTRRRLPVTAEVLATAFPDARSRELFTRARKARIAQDAMLTSYDAKVVQRISVKAGIGAFGPERLAFRQEMASRVRWERGVGAEIEMTGARIAIPLIGSKQLERNTARDNVLSADQSPLPYFPGSESLWIGGLTARADVNDQEIVNMLAEGAEAYYTYATGDSVRFNLGNGRVFTLLELKVRPRSPQWNLAVGSLWFDVASGQLVRAAYRLSAPSQHAVGVTDNDSTAKGAKVAGFIITSLMAPNRAEISAISVEYGLYEGRFWLPRLQSMEGFVQAMFARVPVTFEDAFTYASVNAPLGLQRITVDSIKKGIPHDTLSQCDTADKRVITQNRYDSLVPVRVTVTCDLDKLANSPDLPGSVYDDAEETFGSKDRDKLIAEALSMAAQAPLSLLDLPRPQLQFGPSMMRYNRIEGFSLGVRADQQLGAGLFATAIVRYGFADRKPNVEFALGRSNLSKTIRLNGYTRLVSANDWGNPLSFGAGLGARLFARDEGFYYRARGLELTYTSQRGAQFELRAFTEHESSAIQNVSRTFGRRFDANIDAVSGRFSGASVRTQHAWGLDPNRVRTIADFRLEAATGDSTYGRAALDVTVSRNLFGKFSAALTAAGGSSVGDVPVQRRWFIGTTHTVRGERPDTAQSGNAFWLGRAELARSMPGVRLSLFGDLGWAGDRATFSNIGRPMSGVGIGVSAFDGLIRFDIARGLYPREQTRLALYLNARY